ncbi:TPA: hypothetical protein ACG0OM_003587 [Serratia marcescens]
MDLKKPAKAGFFVPAKWLPPLCRHWGVVVFLSYCIIRLFFSGNKKPDNLEPKRRDYRAPQNGDIKEKQWH